MVHEFNDKMNKVILLRIIPNRAGNTKVAKGGTGGLKKGKQRKREDKKRETKEKRKEF